MMTTAYVPWSGCVAPDLRGEMEQTRNEAVKRTGDLLLGGWKMLSIGCPLCHTALMEKQSKRCCPSCNLPVYYEHETPSIPPPSAPLSTLPVTTNEKVMKSDEKQTKFQSLEEEKKRYDKQRQSNQQIVSSRIGEKLLSGWTLLAKECQTCGTPLMSLNDTKYCVSCDCNPDEQLKQTSSGMAEEKTTVPLGPKTETDLTASALLLTEIPMLPEENDEEEENIFGPVDRASQDLIEEASQLIGACAGNVPLMRNPRKPQQKYCVMCGYFTGAFPETQPVVKPEAKSNPKPVVQEKPEKEESVDDEDIQADEEFLSSYAKKRLREISGNNLDSRAFQPSQSQDFVNIGDDADRYVTEILNKKLCWTAQKLEGEENIETSLQLAALVRALAEGKMVMKKLAN